MGPYEKKKFETPKDASLKRCETSEISPFMT